MSSSLSNLVDNLCEGLHSNKCTSCKSCLDYIITKDDELNFMYFECKNNYKKDFNKHLSKRFANICEFCHGDINRFILLVKKGIYLHEYTDSWERFGEPSLPDKKAFYGSLNMEDITDVDHRHAKKVFENLNNKNLGDYHDFYVQSDALSLADVFENFRNKFIEIDKLDPAHFSSAPGLAWQACLKKTEIELELSTNFDMLLMVEKGIRGGICHAIHRYARANNKSMKNYDKQKILIYSILRFKQFVWMGNVSKIACRWFQMKKNMLNLMKTCKNVKNYDEDGGKGYIFEVDFEYPKNLHDLYSDLPFLPERIKSNKCSMLVCNFYNKNNYVHKIIKTSIKSWTNIKECIVIKSKHLCV